jgi:hypothetical protein
MARVYTATLKRAALGAAATLGHVAQPAASLASEIAIQRIKLFSYATADNAFELFAQRITTIGTSTAVTPQARNPSNPASAAVAGQAHTVEPTYTANAIVEPFGGHQRGVHEFIAYPGHDIIIPKTASNGIGLLMNATTAAFNAEAVIEFEE